MAFVYGIAEQLQSPNGWIIKEKERWYNNRLQWIGGHRGFFRDNPGFRRGCFREQVTGRQPTEPKRYAKKK